MSTTMLPWLAPPAPGRGGGASRPATLGRAGRTGRTGRSGRPQAGPVRRHPATISRTAAHGRPSREVILRRRLAVLALAAVAALAGVLAVRDLAAAPLRGGEARITVRSATDAPSAGTAVAAVPAAEARYVVQPGDTLWSIARRVLPGGDVRPVVDHLAAQLGGLPLDAGQVLVLPSGVGRGR